MRWVEEIVTWFDGFMKSPVGQGQSYMAPLGTTDELIPFYPLQSEEMRIVLPKLSSRDAIQDT